MKTNNNTYHVLIAGLILLCFTTCVEEYVPQTETFEDILVIEANITDELKSHVIKLSRTFRFENEGGALGERNAEVKINDSEGSEYLFQETDLGVYTSVLPFQALSDREYTLSIQTNDGKSYISDSVKLTQKTSIDKLYAERMTNDDGLEGVGIFVDSFDTTGNASFYRYEFEETFRFVAPEFNDFDLILLSDDPLIVDFVRRPLEKRVCYKTNSTLDILITKTEDFDENRVSKFLVRFIGIDDYAISDRYSILTHQFVQSRETYEFYQTLKEFSNSASLFSQIQPGFIVGNIKSLSNEKENVLGLFQVSSISSKRIFFNYRDFFPKEDLPPYFEDCTISAPLIRPSFPSTIRTGLFLFAGNNADPNFGQGGPYKLVAKACGDCTEIGSSEIPEFWKN
ncbi:DUF4249 domain-containing protein [Aquimarina algiphila]|uniref:DUF4249 domain-containing protein n=1 Tax=Aquimarina algiphila TaxID=2047982 RepID=UPI0024913B2A|nr:DUF4249 domain-containing protein [Aquimarina algiphila]